MPETIEAVGGYNLAVVFVADEQARDVVRRQLKAFNDGYTSAIAIARGLDNEMTPLDVLLRDAQATICGGLIGYTHWGWLHVQTLWVAETLRGQGYGRSILVAAEEAAQERGCLYSRLATYSFQARDFYEKLDYQVYGRLEGYPPGYTSYSMKKQLAGAPAAS